MTQMPKMTWKRVRAKLTVMINGTLVKARQMTTGLVFILFPYDFILFMIYIYALRTLHELGWKVEYNKPKRF